ncbi:MAG: inositol monophosphatase, partial [Deltaproteobacteria bacterium]|nr:inositol monophosphatase [Deltaproteobacteria bacterium]
MNLTKEVSIARQAALAAGNVIRAMSLGEANVTKKGKAEIVTDADLLAEKIITDLIGRHFPADGIITEESGECNPTKERVWLIDPLDGTTNFAR